MDENSKKKLITEVSNLVTKEIELKNLTKSYLAKQLNVSSATITNITQLKAGKLKESLLLKIKSKLAPIDEWTLVKTSNFETVQQTCEKARDMRRMFGIVGYTGAGKTTALNSYYRSNPETYMVTCKKTMSPKQFFIHMLRELGVNYTGTIFNIIEKISEELNSKKNPLLIIDEAGKLSHTIMLYLHDLRDSTEHSTGIILAGVEYFESNLQKAADKQKEGMPEFLDRIGFWQFLNNPTKIEKEAVCKLNGITEPADIARVVKSSRNFRHIAQIVQNINNGLLE